MFIIVEGSDGSGKTTLIESLRQRIKKYFWIMRPSHPPTQFYQIRSFLNLIEACPPEVGLLLDRHPLISEPIYGPILRGIDLLEIEDNHTKWNEVLYAHFRNFRPPPFVIYCRPPLSNIIDNVTRTAPQQLEGVVDRIERIVTRYDRFFTFFHWEASKKNFRSATYDYTKPGDSELLFQKINFWLGDIA